MDQEHVQNAFPPHPAGDRKSVAVETVHLEDESFFQQDGRIAGGIPAHFESPSGGGKRPVSGDQTSGPQRPVSVFLRARLARFTEIAVAADSAENEDESDDENDADDDFADDNDEEIIENEDAQEAETPDSASAVPIEISGRRKVVFRYKFSFRAKLIQSPQELQARYGEFTDDAKAYSKVKLSVSWKQVRIYAGRHTLALALFKGRKICIAFALNPADYAGSKYGGIDVSEVKRFEKTPYLIKLTSARKTRYAKELFAAVAEKYGLEKGIVKRSDFYLPYRTTEELVKVNLVKVLSSGEITENTEVVKADISDMIRDKITLAEAGIALSDEVAVKYMERAEDGCSDSKTSAGGCKAVINIDTLSQNFETGDVVTLKALKEKKLVPSVCGSLKILARGTLDKALTVEANSFSIDAVKMILLTGGRPIKIG